MRMTTGGERGPDVFQDLQDPPAGFSPAPSFSFPASIGGFYGLSVVEVVLPPWKSNDRPVRFR